MEIIYGIRKCNKAQLMLYQNLHLQALAWKMATLSFRLALTEVTGQLFKETAGADDIVNSDNGNESGLNKSDIKTSDDNVLTVNSPLVGVFYSSASPEADAYVAIGDRVKKGQVIGIVEAMKLMNEIESDYDGVVTDILVDNEQMVEYGQPMFVIKPV